MQRHIFEGSDFLLYNIDNNPLALSTNCALSIKNNQIDVSTKDSHNWKESMSSIKDWSIEFQGLVSFNSTGLTTNFLLSQISTGDPFFIQMGVIQAGFNHTFWGEVAVESITLDAGNGEVVSYSGTLKGIGKIEFTNNGTPAQSGYLKVENDPVFRGSAAFNITNTHKSDWTEAYNKSPNSIGFITVGNQTTLNLTLRDGTIYSSAFTQVGGGSGNLDLNNYYTKTQIDARFQPLGTYAGLQHLTDNFYSRTQIDNKGFLTSVNWSDLNGKPTIPTATSQLSNDSGFITGYVEIDTLDSVLGRGDTSNKNINVSGKAKFNGSLSIPTSAPANPNSGEHYIYSTGTFGSTGSTGGSYVGVLNDLNDVEDIGSFDGQILMKQNGFWKNVNLPATNFGNYYTKSESTSLFKSIGYVPDWNEVTNKPFIATAISQLSNDSGYVTSSIVNGYALTTTVNSQISALSSIYHPLENQRLSTGNNVEFSRGKFNNALSIPTTAPSSPNAGEHYIYSTGTFGSTGSTGGGGNFTGYLSGLGDVNFSNLLNGQGFTYDATSGKWKNTTTFQGDYNALVNRPALTSMAFENNLLYHRYNTFTADANTVAEHTSNFTYQNNAPHNGYLGYFGANGYGLQINSSYTSGQNISFRQRNGDAGSWHAWRDFWHTGNLTPSYVPTGNSVALRNGSGHISATYFNVTNSDIDASSISDMITTNGSDGYLRRSGLFAVRNWLGLGSAAYTNDASYNLQFVTNRGQYTSNNIGIAYDGVGQDPYGIMSVTRGTGGNYSYYGMTRSGQIGWGIGIDLSNRISFGLTSNGSNNFTMQSIPHTFDSGGNASHGGSVAAGSNLTAGGSLTINGSSSFGGNATINNGSTLSLGNDGSSGYFFSIINLRNETLHKYLYRNSDGAALGWKENWYDGTNYHAWTTDSLGFVANSKLTTVSAGNGAITYQGSLEVRGTNAGITFHYPGSYATSLYMNVAGSLVWRGGLIHSEGHLSAAGNITASNTVDAGNFVRGQRIIAGYDSGVAGSVNASNWFRSEAATGWFNGTYGGGIYMQDTTWVRVYNGKAFLVENEINGRRIVTNDGFKSTTFKGLAGDYDQNGTSDKIIWTIGDGWTTIGTHYGLGYSYTNSLASTQHQIVGRTAGNTTFTLNLTTGGAIFTGDVTAPKIKATQNLAIPNSPPSNPESGVHYLYSTW